MNSGSTRKKSEKKEEIISVKKKRILNKLKDKELNKVRFSSLTVTEKDEFNEKEK